MLDYSTPLNKQSDAQRRNSVKFDNIENVPDGFGWTDCPRLSEEKPPEFLGPKPGPTLFSEDTYPIALFSSVASPRVAEVDGTDK